MTRIIVEIPDGSDREVALEPGPAVLAAVNELAPTAFAMPPIRQFMAHLQEVAENV